MDSLDRIMLELAKCTPAGYKADGALESVYLHTDSIGVIAAHAITLHSDREKAEHQLRLERGHDADGESE